MDIQSTRPSRCGTRGKHSSLDQLSGCIVGRLANGTCSESSQGRDARHHPSGPNKDFLPTYPIEMLSPY